MRLLAILLALIIPTVAHAAPIPVSVPPLSYPVYPGYVGLGDVMRNAAAWYGLRGYNRNYVAAAINVRRGTDNATTDVNINSIGNLDVAGAGVFAGIHATCTGSAAASTTLALTGCSSTPTAGDTLTSTGGSGSFTQPAYIVSCGSFTGGAGSCTMNAAQTVTGVTVNAQVALFITKVYDQTGHGVHLTQATNANQPELLPVCQNTHPCLLFSGAQRLVATTPKCAVNGVEYFSSAVAERTGNFTNRGMVLASCESTNAHFTAGLSFNNSINTANLFAGVSLNATASDSVGHILQSFVPYFGNSTIYVDNTATSGSAGNGGLCCAASALGAVQPGSGDDQFLVGYIMEAGNWQLPVTANQANNVCVNDNAYWFANSKACTTPVTPQSFTAGYVGLCDLVTCAEAWSVTRAMYAGYTGPLFQLYNGTTVLDIGQTSAHAVDMTTWSAFCSGVQSNCHVSKIYSQIAGKNDLVPAVFSTAGSCTGSVFACAAPFTIEGATGLPVVNVVNGQQYAINNFGQNCCSGFSNADDTAATGINGGTNPNTLVINGRIPFQTSVCCGHFGLAHHWQAAANAGSDFSFTIGWNQSFFGSCAATANYCFTIDAEDLAGAPDFFQLGNTQFNYILTMDHFTSPNTVEMFYNGHTAFQNSPPLSTPVNLYSGPYVHFGGGGDLTQPAPAIWREALVTNNVLSSTDRANVLTNSTAFYSGLSFP